MAFQTLPFKVAYDNFYDEINKSDRSYLDVLEIGAGAHPSITNRKNLHYTIVDPDQNEIGQES